MRIFLITLAGAAALAASAAAQDTPPPGCRWQDGGATLACKDGKGYWRRSGDGEIVGRYGVAKPARKPAPRPVAQAAPAVAPPIASLPATPPLAPPPPPPPPETLTPQEAADAAEILGGPAPAEPTADSPPAAEAPAKPPAEPWWRRIFTTLWDSLLVLLRAVGLLR